MADEHRNEFLPDDLPSDPMPLFKQWFDFAWQKRLQPNANAMVLATVNAQSEASARIVLCKQVIVSPGFIVFYTNYQSRKGQDLDAHGQAAVVFHWDALHRQVRMAGPVVKSPSDESDEYFASRPLASRIGAWASKQSEPLASRQALAQQVLAVERQYAVSSNAADELIGNVPRPPHWGGYRLWPQTLELWIEGPGRIHDRATWTRQLTRSDAFNFAGSNWHATRLNP